MWLFFAYPLVFDTISASNSVFSFANPVIVLTPALLSRHFHYIVRSPSCFAFLNPPSMLMDPVFSRCLKVYRQSGGTSLLSLVLRDGLLFFFVVVTVSPTAISTPHDRDWDELILFLHLAL
jgi:hypothetical protein